MGFIGGLLNFLIVLCSIFLICLVLIQRGRGGGLAGAFGGLGGSSAFGTKAGDVFTRVTVVTAIIWFVLCMALVVINNQGRQSAFVTGASPGAAASREVAPTQEGTPGPPPPSTGAEVPPGVPPGAIPPSAAPPSPAEAPGLPAVFDEESGTGAPAASP